MGAGLFYERGLCLWGRGSLLPPKSRTGLCRSALFASGLFCRSGLVRKPPGQADAYSAYPSSDKMGAGRGHVSDLYQQALMLYPASPKLLARAAGFYQRNGNPGYAAWLANAFEKACRFNCIDYRKIITAERQTN